MNAPAYVRSWLEAVDGDEKFVLTMGAGVINTCLLLLHFIDQGTYATLTISTVAAFIGGNVIENMRNRTPPEDK